MYDYMSLLFKCGVTPFVTRTEDGQYDRLEFDRFVYHGDNEDLSHLCLRVIIVDPSRETGVSYRYAIVWRLLSQMTGLCKADFAPFVEEKVDLNMCVRKEFPALLEMVKSSAASLEKPGIRSLDVAPFLSYEDFVAKLEKLFTLVVICGVAGFMPIALTMETVSFMVYYMEGLYLADGVVYILRPEVLYIEFAFEVADEPDVFYYMIMFNGYRQFSLALAEERFWVLPYLVALLMRVFDWEFIAIDGLVFKLKADVFPDAADLREVFRFVEFAPGTTSLDLEEVRYKLTPEAMESLYMQLIPTGWPGWLLSEGSLMYELEIAKDKQKRLLALRKAASRKLPVRSYDVYNRTQSMGGYDVPEDLLSGFPNANLNERSVVTEEVSSSVTHKSSSGEESVSGDVSAIIVVEEADELIKSTDGSTGEHSEEDQQTMKDIPVVVEEVETFSWWKKVVNCLSCCSAAARA